MNSVRLAFCLLLLASTSALFSESAFAVPLAQARECVDIFRGQSVIKVSEQAFKDDGTVKVSSGGNPVQKTRTIYLDEAKTQAFETKHNIAKNWWLRRLLMQGRDQNVNILESRRRVLLSKVDRLLELQDHKAVELLIADRFLSTEVAFFQIETLSVRHNQILGTPEALRSPALRIELEGINGMIDRAYNVLGRYYDDYTLVREHLVLTIQRHEDVDIAETQKLYEAAVAREIGKFDAAAAVNSMTYVAASAPEIGVGETTMGPLGRLSLSKEQVDKKVETAKMVLDSLSQVSSQNKKFRDAAGDRPRPTLAELEKTFFEHKDRIEDYQSKIERSAERWALLRSIFFTSRILEMTQKAVYKLRDFGPKGVFVARQFEAVLGIQKDVAVVMNYQNDIQTVLDYSGQHVGRIRLLREFLAKRTDEKDQIEFLTTFARLIHAKPGFVIMKDAVSALAERDPLQYGMLKTQMQTAYDVALRSTELSRYNETITANRAVTMLASLAIGTYAVFHWDDFNAKTWAIFDHVAGGQSAESLDKVLGGVNEAVAASPAPAQPETAQP